jgi:hypothetical protein
MNALERFLLGENVEVDSSVLLAANLGGYAFTRLPEQREVFKGAYAQASLRHAQIRQNLRKLVSLWNQHGLEPLLFKGFALAEFFYKDPAMRFYGDVDIFVPESQAAQASQLASELGWLEAFNREDSVLSFQDRHEYSHLYSPDRTVRLDLHVRLLQGVFADPRHVRFSEAIWKASQRQAWQGIAVRVPNPLDALLVMLMNRRWGNPWTRKPHDMLDAKLLAEGFGLTGAHLEQRASELGCARTLEVILQDFDPWKGRLVLQRPGRLERLQRDWLCRRDLGSYVVHRGRTRLMGVPTIAHWTLQTLPVVARVLKMMRQTSDIKTLVTTFEAEPAAQPDRSRTYLEGAALGVRWALRLFGYTTDTCVPRSLALFYLLSQQGHALRFVSGVRRHNGKLEGHAWVEIDGWPLEATNDMPAPQRFKENFSYGNRLERERKQKGTDVAGQVSEVR